MGYIDAELDLAPIDKVDVRNELRRFTVLPATEADFQNFASYSASVCSSPFPGVLLVEKIDGDRLHEVRFLQNISKGS